MATHRKYFLVKVGGLTLFLLNPAYAHVKWFIPFNIAEPPLAIGAVLTKPFILLFLCSVLLIYLFFLIDRFLFRQKFSTNSLHTEKTAFHFSVIFMRVCTAFFFLSLGIFAFKTGNIFILTPDLRIQLWWIPWLYIFLSLCAVSKYTLPLIGGGLLFLYTLAIVHYGIFHLMDYIIFLGIAYFFLIIGMENESWKKSAFIILFGFAGITLCWGAIEKFAYPQRILTLVKLYPEVLIGPRYYFGLVCGFVEFNLIFILLSAASVLTRLIAFLLNCIFILAIFEFGTLDALGHLMLIAVFIVLIIHGPTDARNMLVLEEKALGVEAYFMTGLYVFAFVMFFIMYYGFYYLLV